MKAEGSEFEESDAVVGKPSSVQNNRNLAAALLSIENARSIPYWFVAIVGIVYASGFIAVELFLSTFGLRDVGAELWKARFIHVGVLCSVFPILPLLTVALLFKTSTLLQKRDRRPFFFVRIANGLLLYLLPQTAFYILIFFGRRPQPGAPHYLGFDALRNILILSIVGLLVFGPAPIVLVEAFLRRPSGDWRFPEPFWSRVGVALRVILSCALLWLFWLLLKQYGDLLWELVKYHYLPLSAFLLCTISIPAFPVLRKWYLGKTEAGGAKVVNPETLKTEPAEAPTYPNLTALTVCFSIPIYYLSLVTFSSSMFGYLPATRGGGDYTVAPIIIVKLKPEFVRDPVTKQFLEPDVPASGYGKGGRPKRDSAATVNSVSSEKDTRGTALITQKCILIEETASALFVALPLDAGGPIEWRKSQANRPNVLEIDRNAILAIEYLHP